MLWGWPGADLGLPTKDLGVRFPSPPQQFSFPQEKVLTNILGLL